MDAPRWPAPSSLEGVVHGSATRHADRRGSLREVWRDSSIGLLVPEPFVQANLSTSAAGVLRGLHLHARQTDLWFVAEGRAFVALVDIRRLLEERTEARPPVDARELRADDWVVIPPGVAHGFLALEPLSLVYLVTNEYDGTDELGFAWDDPRAAVPWPRLAATPGGRPILSDRDASNPSLDELVAGLRR